MMRYLTVSRRGFRFETRRLLLAAEVKPVPLTRADGWCRGGIPSVVYADRAFCPACKRDVAVHSKTGRVSRHKPRKATA